VLVEYAKAAPDDILIRIAVTNRGPENATLHLLTTLWYRNTWAWDRVGPARPTLRKGNPNFGRTTVEANHPSLGHR
jgi:hypothetical protein